MSLELVNTAAEPYPMSSAPLYTISCENTNHPGPNPRVDLAIVIPTYNERDNIPELFARLEETLTGLVWEVIVVDDDSPDHTAELVRDYAQIDHRFRVLHRIGRRGLASACIEGVLATTANTIAIMDADLQHDEAILPRMFETLRKDSLDLVVGTRNAEGGSMGQFCPSRIFLSKLGKRISNTVCQCEVSDPMSGYFLFSRSFFLEVVHQLYGGGFKILVDMLSCSRRPVRFGEVGYTFRSRKYGESKLDVSTAIEYLFLIVDKLSNSFIPARFTAFALVASVGVGIHLAFLTIFLRLFHLPFVSSQIAATYIAMTGNFFLNNHITWRDRRLRGLAMVSGLAAFWLACSFGAWANVLFARSLLQSGSKWFMAGIAGIVLSSVWNYSVSNLLIWQISKRRPGRDNADLEAAAFSPEL